MKDFRGMINGPLHPLTIRAQSNRLLVYRKRGEIEYYIRPLSLDWFIEREVFKTMVYGEPRCADEKVVDVGAHIGLASLMLAASGARVISLEPDPVNFPMLLLNSAMNDLHIEAYRMAVGPYRGKALFKKERNSGNSSLISYSWGSSSWVTVDAVRLDMFLPCDFLKMDVEGAEYAILKDLDWAKSVRRGMVLEYHKHVPDWKVGLRHIMDGLQLAGFKIDSQSHGYNGYLKAERQ